MYDRFIESNILCHFRKDGPHKQTNTKKNTLLFNAMTDAEETLAHLRQTLIDAQRQAEELYLEQEVGGAIPQQTR